MRLVHASEANTAQLCDLAFPRGDVAFGEVRQAVVAAGPRQNLHELYTCSKITRQAFRADLHIQPFAQFRLLRRNTNWTVVGVAHSRRDTADRLHCRVAYGDCIRAQGHGLCEVFSHTQPPCDHQRHLSARPRIQMLPGPGQCRDRRH
jgi:hypothetical protein